jgi:hypothetical protein
MVGFGIEPVGCGVIGVCANTIAPIATITAVKLTPKTLRTFMRHLILSDGTTVATNTFPSSELVLQVPFEL